MATTSIKETPTLTRFLNYSSEEVMLMSPQEAIDLRDIIEALSNQFTGNKQAFASLQAAVHNSISFFGTAGMAYEEMTNLETKLETTPAWRQKTFTHRDVGKMKQDFEKHRAWVKLQKDYTEARESFFGLLGMARRFLLQAQQRLREC